ncbi:MAG TPA: glycoside hydrolase family 19 protein [Leptospiraceae bacterium]|nr:glycoside hydrolase family 19 protein [Leptospiraceae bacterium]
MQFNREKIFKLYEKFYKEILKRNFTEEIKKNLDFVLNCIEDDTYWNDYRQVANFLAQVGHEVGWDYRPKREKQASAGTSVWELQKKYWLTNYMGRGLLQITHKANYEKLGKLLNIPLVQNPDLALEPEISYKIAAKGMQLGLFTGKKLNDYINTSKVDYLNARRIVNGSDRAKEIEYYSKCIESILKVSIVEENVWTIEVPKTENDEVQKPVTEVIVPPEQAQQPANIDYIEPVLPKITSGIKSWKTAISGVVGSTGLGAAYSWLAEKYQSINNISGIVITVLIVAAAFGIVYFIMRERAKIAREKMAHEITLEQLRIRANPDLTNVEIKRS